MTKPDPYAALRHLDGTWLECRDHTFTEDADGMPLGVESSDFSGFLCLPPLPDEDDNE